jgi:alpha-L-fucosidase
VPAWWLDAKLGIFVHWTPASVPAFAPIDAEVGELMAQRRPDAMAWSPYAEWYQNSLRFPDSPAARHHATHHPGVSYDDFARTWEDALEGWDPDAWAARFAATGARYVVLVTKHHDGYCLWPTTVTNPHHARWACPRDVVGELAEAVRGHGLRFGVYYSGGLDWTFNDHPIGTFSDLIAAQPRGDYVAYAEAQVRELIDRYRPSVLWNDISWPAPKARLADLLAGYYAAVPDGVVNDRFMPWSPAWALAGTGPGRRGLDAFAARSAANDRGIVPPKPPLFDVRTPEYTTFDDIATTPWECVRGIDRSFGHNRESSEEHFLTRAELVGSLVDIASKGGNLLLNVGPRGEDATIADAQLRRLGWLEEFTSTNGDALFGTRPWVTPAGTDDDDAIDVRYTARDRHVYAFVRAAGRRGADGRSDLVLAEVGTTPTTRVTEVGGGRLEAASGSGRQGGLAVRPSRRPTPEEPLVLDLHDVTATSGV